MKSGAWLAQQLWMREADCLLRPALFARESFTATTARAAQLVCRSCPVLSRCDAYARAIRPTWGVWAGRVWTPVGRPLPVPAAPTS